MYHKFVFEKLCRSGEFSLKYLLEYEKSACLDARYLGFCYNMSHSRILHYFDLPPLNSKCCVPHASWLQTLESALPALYVLKLSCNLQMVSVWVTIYCMIPPFNAFRAPVILPRRQAFVPVLKY